MTDGYSANIVPMIIGSGDILPTRDQVEGRLQDALLAVRNVDQQSNDVIADHIRVCRNWGVRERAEATNNHYYLDTYIVDEDEGAVFIEIDHAYRRKDGSEDDESTIQRQVEQQVLAQTGQFPVDTHAVNEFVVSSARWAHVWYFTPEALSFLREDAAEGTDMLSLLRVAYNQRQTVREDTEGDITQALDRSRHENTVHEKHIFIGPVALNGPLPVEDTAGLLRDAEELATEEMIEATCHQFEYLGLYNRYRFDPSLELDERLGIVKRLREIQAGNGVPPDVHFLQWRPTFWLAEQTRDELNIERPGIWDEKVYEVLINSIRGDALYLNERNFRARQLGSRLIRKHVLLEDK